MKRSHIALALMAAAAFSSTASGAFYIEDSGIVGSEHGQMGKFQTNDAQGKASFAAPSGGMEPKQARYKDAELLVDLAYTPVSQRGSGEPGIVPGYGDEIPFDGALSMILPSGWQVYKAKEMDKKSIPLLISFAGGRTWPDVLKLVGERYALHFHIDWYDRTIMLSQGRQGMAMQASQMRVIPEPPMPLAQAQSYGAATPVVPVATSAHASPALAVSTVVSASPTTPGVSAATKPLVTPTVKAASAPSKDFAAAKPPVASVDVSHVAATTPTTKQVASATPDNAWRASKGDNLKVVIERWNESAQYKAPIWEARNIRYTLKSDLVLHGTYEQALTSLLRSDSEIPPLNIEGSRNLKIIKVTDKEALTN